MKTKAQNEGLLRYYTDEGWILFGDRPSDWIRVRDLFQEFAGKRVRVTVEVLQTSRPTRKDRP